MPFTLDFMLLVALSIEVESRSLQENLSQKESSEARLPYDKQIRKDECEKQDLEERLRRTERPMIFCPGQLYITVSKEQLNEDRSQLRDRETKLENVETQPRELQEQFSGLEELKEGATKCFRENFQRQLRELQEKLTTLKEHNEICILRGELKIKRKFNELNELEGEPTDGEQDIVQLEGDLFKRVTKLENVETQPRELQEQFSILEELKERETKFFRENVQTQLRELQEKFTIFEEHRERETCIPQDESKIKRKGLNELERELRDREHDAVQLKRDLKEAKETLSKYELKLKTRDWILSRDEVELTDKCLAEGEFATVLEGRYCDCPVAVKQLKESNLTPKALSLFEREIDIASRCRHPCLLLFIGATKDENCPLFVTELMDLSLRALLGKRQLSETEVSVISLDVARALEYLHQRRPTPIIHRNVRSANVLLWKQNNQWRGKLSDYGTATFVAEIMTKNPGAVIYEAPEASNSDYQTEVGLST